MSGDEIWQVPFLPAPSVAHLSIELLTFAELQAMDQVGRRRRPQRPSFYVIALVHEGRGHHRLDFVSEALLPRTVALLRPGVVHQWTDVDALKGLLILFTPTMADADVMEAIEVSRTRRLSPSEWNLVRVAADHLRAEYADAKNGSTSAQRAILRHALAALILRANGEAPLLASGEDHLIFRAYRAAVDEHFHNWRQVSHYARELGYSPRTLSRATHSAAGVGAKQFLADRTALEAKRLLGHTDLTIAECADALGFSQASNFTTFFVHQSGRSPSDWRDLERRTLDGYGPTSV